MTRVCDYEGSNYRTEFWENENRGYEDGVERIAVNKMLPPTGERLLEIGGGFGRLVDLYSGYKQVVLSDYARTQVEEAQQYLGTDDRIVYVVADIYNLPFVDNLFDSSIMIRVMHHLTDVPDALGEIQRILRADGTSVIEYANKRNVKAIARWLLRQQNWHPFKHDPIEFVEMNFNFHPRWMHEQFAQAGFQINNKRSLSHYRIQLLKKYIPTDLLIKLDAMVQPTGNYWQLTPSIMVEAQAKKEPHGKISGLFRCPQCHNQQLYMADNPTDEGELMICHPCQIGWTYRDGIYDFKTPQSI
ncbi:class I SAM-dependent methyltransferase [Anaerolineales bacterium HSG25]|nr:class I SAM-dependent methyltransferase [Anaerolineales bacterium HSG25]